METILPVKKATAADYRRLPEGALYQLINAELVMSPAQKKSHQEILGEIFLRVGMYLKSHPIGKVYPSPFDVHFDEENIFQPDICFIVNENLKNFHEDGYYYGSPDMVIEILSPSNAIIDLTEKFRIYERFGVIEYFIVDPDSKEVMAYILFEGRYYENYREKGIIGSTLLNAIFSF